MRSADIAPITYAKPLVVLRRTDCALEIRLKRAVQRAVATPIRLRIGKGGVLACLTKRKAAGQRHTSVEILNIAETVRIFVRLLRVTGTRPSK
nr:MAG TPA: hypothetical protein [Caudoviricetes sp.]